MSRTLPLDGRWVITQNEENFNGPDFATREEAIAAAPAEFNLVPGDRFFVGRCYAASWSAPDGDDAVEHLANQAMDEYGECAEEWPDATKEQRAELGELIGDVVEAWMKRHGLEPTFYGISDSEQIRVPPSSTTPEKP
jgi:hypothetical protein